MPHCEVDDLVPVGPQQIARPQEHIVGSGPRMEELVDLKDDHGQTSGGSSRPDAAARPNVMPSGTIRLIDVSVLSMNDSDASATPTPTSSSLIEHGARATQVPIASTIASTTRPPPM